VRATLIYGPRDIRSELVGDPEIRRPTDVIVRVIACCVCGSDLWAYRGVWPTPQPRRIGHEYVGEVIEVGAAVAALAPGDFVVAPFVISDGTCPACRHGITTSCERRSVWGDPDAEGLPVDGGQGEYVRAPFAETTLVATPEPPPAGMIPDLLALSDVMGTGHHAAVCAGVGKGARVVVVGDGAVGLCAVAAARRLGAEQIVAMSRHPARQALAREFGASGIVEQRGDEGVAAVRELLGGGADAALECVGTKESMQQAIGSVRPGGRVGFVGVPAGGPELPIGHLFEHNIGVAGGVAPVRTYLPDLMADVLGGNLRPGAVFDLTLPLAEVAEGYAAMDQRRAIKALLQP
jgi:threonine dehydrogenase-like Zn-dependent dehydrogenase